MMGAPRLEARAVSKAYAGVPALAEVDLALQPGEVLGLVGENGAGKSTLMKCLAGVVEADAGEFAVDGERVGLDSPRAAQRYGIALIHQELNLATNLDVAANVCLGREDTRLGFLRPAAMRARAQAALERIGADFDADAPLEELSVGRRQLVEIAKALSQEARVLILDEPTSSLTQLESERLFEVIGELARQGVSVIYISHRLAELPGLVDRVLALRDGRAVGELAGDELEHAAIVRLMVGRELAGGRRVRARDGSGEPMLEVRGLGVALHPRQRVDLALAPGERVGLAGLVGAGRSELLRALFGVDRALAGEVRLGGRALAPGDPRASVRAGLGLVPEDRKEQGLLLEMSVRENISLGVLHRQQRLGFLRAESEAQLSAEMGQRLRLRAADDRMPARLLSGGNQQKVVLARWLALEPRVLLLDEPTRGVDVGARAEIYAILEGLSEAGVGVLFASSDPEELLSLSDRVLVLHEGAIVAELEGDQLDEATVQAAVTGGGRAS